MKRGAPKGNTNASLPKGQRGRIGWTLGLSGNELTEALQLLGIEHLNNIEARKVLREKSEEFFMNGLKALEARKKQEQEH